jgi:5'-nucleotidase
MPLDLADTLVVGISATALFDLAEADASFRANYAHDPHTALAQYRQYMLPREHEPLGDGVGMPLVRALLGMNKYAAPSTGAPLVDVVVMSRNSPEAGARVANHLRSLGLPISRHAFTGGEPLVDYLEAFGVDLFLTTHADDAQRVIDAQACAAAVLRAPPSSRAAPPANQVRIAFDGDAMLFDESSALLDQPESGSEPHAVLLRKLARLQERLPSGVEFSPLRVAIVSSRGAPSDMRAMNTLRHWGVQVNDSFSLGGLEKTRIVKAFRPHILFDDLDPAAPDSGRLAHRSDWHLRAAAKPAPSPEPPLLVETLADDLPDLAVSIDAG